MADAERVTRECWVSDADSGLAHLSVWASPSRNVHCGIHLGDFSTTVLDLPRHAEGKPKCSACIERMEPV